jgi:hypothetical protein
MYQQRRNVIIGIEEQGLDHSKKHIVGKDGKFAKQQIVEEPKELIVDEIEELVSTLSDADQSESNFNLVETLTDTTLDTPPEETKTMDLEFEPLPEVKTKRGRQKNHK